MTRTPDATHEATYRTFVEILKHRQRLFESDPAEDFRDHLLSRRFEPFNIGFRRENIRTAFSANLPGLFPNLVALNDPDFGKSRNFLLYGAVVDEPALSHDSAMKLLPHMDASELIYLFEMGFLASCNSWSEAIAARSPKMACLGYVYDDIAQFFMTDYPNRLTQKLNSDAALSEAERARARGLIDRIVRQRISKYNSQPIYWPAMTPGYKRRVLVVDQNFSDASTLFGRASPEDFKRLLESAIAENPDAEILVKTHPDLNWVKGGRRTGYFNHMTSSGRVRIIRDSVNPHCLFDLVDKVYVGTSGMGLEALLAGKQVVCFGAPFYAGWGFTDDRQEIPHRKRPRSLEEVFHFFYLWYTIYHVPGCEVPSEIEDVLDYIAANRPVRLPPSAPPETPRISIVIPVHGVEKYIGECLRSIQLQSFQDYEILTVNDTSPDRSQEIIDGIAAHDPRLRPLVLTENVGPGFARNKALEAARGDYIVFIDPDDYMPDPGHLERMVARADRDQADMIRYRKAFEQIEDETDQIVGRRRDETERFFDGEFHAVRFADRPEIAHSRHFWNWMYRRSFLDANDVRFLTTYREERAFLVQAFLADPVISSVDSAGVVYRIRRDSAVRREQTASDVRDQVFNFEQVIKLLAGAGGFEPASPLRWYGRFQVSQFLHYLIFDFAYRTAAEDPALLVEFCERLGAAVRSTGLTADDLIPDPIQLWTRHLDASAYGLILEALRSGRTDFIALARNLEPIPADRLHAIFLQAPETELEADFQRALGAYARNERVVPAAQPRRLAGPKPRIVVHIGASKTGSTSLQHLMDINRPALLRKGIWYPEVGVFWQPGRPRKQSGHSRFVKAAADGDPALRDYIESGLAGMDGRIHTVVLSSEGFFLDARAPEIASYFEGYPFEMVVYLRRQDEWANAQYAEFVAGGAVGRVDVPFQRWLKGRETQARLDYRIPITAWATRIGAENVRVRVFERGQMQDGDLIADFAAVADLPPLLGLPPLPDELQNVGRLSAAHVELIRLFNIRRFRGKSRYFRFIEEATAALIAWRDSRGLPMPKPWIPDADQAEAIMAGCAEGNREIAQRFLGREDGILFHEKATPPEPTPVYPEEFAIVSAAFERVTRARPAAAESAIMNYGLFGWRRWALTPVLQRLYRRRTGQALPLEFSQEPALYARRHWVERHARLAWLLYPESDPMGPFGLFRIWVPILRPLARRQGGTTMCSCSRRIRSALSARSGTRCSALSGG